MGIPRAIRGMNSSVSREHSEWLCSDTAELLFEDCFVPDENVIGEEGRGFYALVRNLQNERLVIGALALGEAMKAIEITLDWVKQRKALQIANARFTGGASSKLSVYQAENVLGQTEAAIPQLQVQLDQGLDALRLLLGMPPQSLDP